MARKKKTEVEFLDLDELDPIPAPKAKREIVTRWGGHAALLSKGFVAVPVTFLAGHASMKPFNVTPSEALFIIGLMAHKWDERAPYPGYKKLARWMGITESYARKLARSLEQKRLLKRRPRIGATNEFDLQPLFDKLLEHVTERPSTGRKQKSPAKRRRPRQSTG